MAVHLIWSPLAKADFKKAVAYIRDENTVAANSWRKSLLEQVELLADFPELGRILPEQSDWGVREIIYSHYRIIYRLAQSKDRVEILRLWHAARGEPELDK